MSVRGDRDVPAYGKRGDKIDTSSPSRIQTATILLGEGGGTNNTAGRGKGESEAGVVNLNGTNNG